MAFNYGKLRGRIREKFGSERAFATAMKMSTSSLSDRLNQGSSFRQSEIANAIELLHIEEHDLAKYFFDKDVQ